MKHQTGRMLLGAITLAFLLCLAPIRVMGISAHTLHFSLANVSAGATPETAETIPAVTQLCGDSISWQITDSGTLILTGTGAMYDYDPASGVYAPWYEQRTSIKAIVVGDGITHIGNGAFYGSSTVTSLSLPTSVNSIGSDAFYDLGLTSLTLHEGITEIGSYAFSHSELINVVLPDSLTYIPEGMFSDSQRLNTVEIPEMITYIGDYAFAHCYYLSNIVFPEGLVSIGTAAFELCGAYKWYDGAWYFSAVTLPRTLERIGDRAFQGCHGLNTIDIPDNVKHIGERAFHECRTMTQITISGSIESLGDWALASSWQDKPLKKVIFNWSVPSFEEETFFGQRITCYYPSNNPDWTADVLQNYGGTITWVGQEMEEPVVQKCGDNIFWEITENGTLVLTGTGAMYDYDVSAQQYAPWHEQRTAITAIEIGSGITHIGNNAFYDSPTVRSLSLPATLTSIGSYAFYKIGIQSLELQEGITEIGRGAFEESALRSVSLPDSLTYIPDNLFRFSYYLVTVDLPEMITYIGDEAFRSCAGLSSMVLPEGLKRIGRSAFACCGSRTIWGGVYPCTNFTEITLPDSLEEIADEAFNWCERLGNVTIPENVTRIGKYAFSRCGFTEITIPAGVQELGSYAFFLCSGLKTVRFQWTRPTIAGNAFSDVTATCYYPSNNPAWTADVLQNYSGKLTWIGQEMEEPGVSAPIEITVKNVGASTSGAVITAPEGGWKAGSNTFTVSCPAPCVVAVSSDGGLTYTRLTATALGDAYSFTAEDMTADTILAVALFGDVDGNGKLTNLDAARCRSGYLRFLELDGLQQLIADVNKDGKLTNLDAARLRSIYLRYLTPEW